ncbi:L-aspartate oxidase [Nocardia cyriacigeorgica]|uniref:L-aspartate oxidase n=1 Tax=Nocardia cyriacigeorgica TaxID=135487 RepID=UPI001895974C|nr:L-aspartate oxidase [Nocardia cyriacigeorgica]MBF6398705.1 L-aspartate oxidase [Nocardia cyriacigeorgica]MBF6403781.1 L-aspartate oxidase [Nocardia cyriacigeorgica]
MNAPAFDWTEDADFVVIGGGVAGLTAARTAAQRGLRVLVLSKGGPTDTSTQYAQGGIAVVAPHGDSVQSHVRDTVAAGGGLCDIAAVESIVTGGQDAVAALTDLGAVFDLGRDGQISRTREGGHSTRRIIHAGGDATGAEVQRALNAAGLPVLFRTAAVRIVTGERGVRGVVAVSGRGIGAVRAPAVLLATGGLGQLYALSTNPPGATADGIALALWAGAEVADLEFVQFHPTVLHTPGGLGRRPLISEAVRGEGAVLVDSRGESVTAGVHPLGDLAPRDVVSRSIADRMRVLGDDHVYLDARSVDGFLTRFPTITASCLAAGIDPRTDLIPVAPAAHYQCGGIVTDVCGRTSVPGLYAAGEVARTGLHGANRLASNSLLEGLVVGERAGVEAVTRLGEPTGFAADEHFDVPWAPRELVQRLMTAHAAVVRDAAGLTTAIEAIERAVRSADRAPRPSEPGAMSENDTAPGHLTTDPDATSLAVQPAISGPSGSEGMRLEPSTGVPADVAGARRAAGPNPTTAGLLTARIAAFEDAALTVTARALLLAAAAREESRGCHTRSDHPAPVEAARHSTSIRLAPDGTPHLTPLTVPVTTG